MFIKRVLGWHIFLIPIIITMLFFTVAVKELEEIPSVGFEAPVYGSETPVYSSETMSDSYEVPIYKISISESTQRYIWKLCEENHFSYELALAVYQIEGNYNTQIDSIKAEIEKLVYYRNYWTEQGFPDEVVFDLVLLSRQRGIEGCKIFMEDNDSYYLDSYVQKVTEYKYYLEQMDDGFEGLQV